MSIRTAWQTICGLKTGAAKAKQQVLFEFLSKPPRQWAQRLVSMSDEITMSEIRRKKAVTLTRGQLEVQHGFMEASEMIAKGKYKRFLDADGDEMFVRVDQELVQEKSRKRSVVTTRTAQKLTIFELMTMGATEDEMLDLEGNFGDWVKSGLSEG
eukprot:6461934-Lingulodinium_polyedra.AAC.1